MRGEDRSSGSLFSYVDLEGRVPGDHPLRVIREIVNEVLSGLSSEFEHLYSPTGRPSIAPEQLLRALLLQAFYSIRSERQLMEQLDFNMLFRWFVGLGLDDAVWDASTFCHNRDRLLEADISGLLLSGVVEHRKVRRLLSRDHFSVDGTLIEAWASMKSFRAKDGRDGDDPPAGRNSERDFHGQKRSNETHESTTDPQARLYRKGNGRESRLCFMGHALMENRNGLVVGGSVTPASGAAEREAALELLDKHRPPGGKGGGRRITLGSDTQAVGAGPAMTHEGECAVVGKWRIVEADLWDRDYLDLVEPASITFEGDGHGEFAFGCVKGGLDCEYSRRIIFFTWQGFDEMDEASGDGAAELDDDGSLEIEFRYHLGDEAILKAHKW